MNLIINTDGASRGNPGPASYGYIVKSNTGVILHQEGKVIGVTTNNIAEYTAVLKSLEYIEKKYIDKIPHEIEVIADSELIIRQLSGRYRVKNLRLKEIYYQIKQKEKTLGKIIYRSVPRKENYIADRLANIALDTAKKIPHLF
ncbi:ribonuclease HI family protein [Candidatus Daviesbacteria bacterium]|nr:ribonuclease HI family protein [Candidatus Daviesbacteria bacterium]